MYYIEKDNKIVLADENKQRLLNTLKLTPQYQGLEVKESDSPVELWQPPKNKGEQIAELKSFLASTDYITSKIVEASVQGESTAELVSEYSDVLDKRADARKKINELEEA